MMSSGMETLSISIHASAKEATALSSTVITTLADFNPRLREGGDERFAHLRQPGNEYFNPRLREGGDANTAVAATGTRQISIHASAKEATCKRSLVRLRF